MATMSSTISQRESQVSPKNPFPFEGGFHSRSSRGCNIVHHSRESAEEENFIATFWPSSNFKQPKTQLSSEVEPLIHVTALLVEKWQEAPDPPLPRSSRGSTWRSSVGCRRPRRSPRLSPSSGKAWEQYPRRRGNRLRQRHLRRRRRHRNQRSRVR